MFHHENNKLRKVVIPTVNPDITLIRISDHCHVETSQNSMVSFDRII